MSEHTRIFASVIGCDVGKSTIAVFDERTSKAKILANDAEALRAWAAAIPPDTLVICEATGGYESLLLRVLVEAQVAAHRADARKVKRFIQSFGIMGKTDAIDAKALARYGKERQSQLALWEGRDAIREQIQLLTLARNDLIRDQVAYKNRMSAPNSAPLETCFKAVIATLTAEIKALNAQIAALIAQSETLAKDHAALCGITGIGAITATQLLALMPELGTLSRKQAAALAGLAPHPRQSGQFEGYRCVRGGRPCVKHAVFMAALSAAKRHETLKPFYDGLIARGKKPIVALVAVMRKLIVIANAVMKHNRQGQQLS